MLETNGFARKLLDPTEREAIALNNMAVQFMKDLEKNPMKAKLDFNATILPHMMRAIRTVKVLDEHLEAASFEVKKLLKANVVLIDLLKRNNIDMPNFAEIEREVEDARAEEHANRGKL
jgi:hypothetical protein